MRRLGFIALALAGCSAAALPTSATQTFDPLTFFAGRAQGTGTVHRLFGSTVPLRVASTSARRTPDSLVLVQRIREGSKTERTRTWSMRRTAPGVYTGTLTPDAVGPVTMNVTGPRAHIRYQMKGGLAVVQQLALQRGGDVLCNRLEVRKFGIRVAWVRETIERVPPIRGEGNRVVCS